MAYLPVIPQNSTYPFKPAFIAVIVGWSNVYEHIQYIEYSAIGSIIIKGKMYMKCPYYLLTTIIISKSKKLRRHRCRCRGVEFFKGFALRYRRGPHPRYVIRGRRGLF